MQERSPLKNPWFYITIIGILLTASAIITAWVIDKDLWDGNAVRFSDDAGDILIGTYYPGESDAGILLLEGFGSDQVTMRSAAREFAESGYHVFSFDFSGHGRSPGTLAYDNAETPRLANQTLSALTEFEALSGLPREKILLLGHSLGARVALQTATIDPSPAGLILLGTQVNLSTNTQAEFFTGVSDNELEWVQELDPNNPATNILLISGEWDDILTPRAAGLLFEKLTGTRYTSESSFGNIADRNGREMVIFPRLLHNYEVFSPRVLTRAQDWGAGILNLSVPDAVKTFAALRVWSWVLALLGLFISMVGAAGWRKSTHPVEDHQPYLIRITILRRFLVAKLLLWLGAIPLGALLAGIFFFLPIGLPTFNLIYVAFFGGYGILMYLLYRMGRMPGTHGRLPFTEPSSSGKDYKGIAAAFGFTVLLLFVTAAFARSGWFYVYPLNARILWLLLFSLPTALGFWIGIYEIGMVARAAPGNTFAQIGVLLIGILPFFLYTGFLAFLGSLSGVIGGLQGLLILAVVLTFGYLLRQFNKYHWVTAICQSLLLYWLILPQGVLFG